MSVVLLPLLMQMMVMIVVVVLMMAVLLVAAVKAIVLVPCSLYSRWLGEMEPQQRQPSAMHVDGGQVAR